MDFWLFFMGMSHITFHLVFALVLWLALAVQQSHVELHLRINGAKGVFVFAFFFVFVMLSYT